MQSAYHIAIPYPQASNHEKWSYLHKSFMGQLHFAQMGKSNGVLKFQSEEDARTWWVEHKEKLTATDKVFIIKRITPAKNDKDNRACRIIKELYERI